MAKSTKRLVNNLNLHYEAALRRSKSSDKSSPNNPKPTVILQLHHSLRFPAVPSARIT